MSDYPILISNKLHSFRNFGLQIYIKFVMFTNSTMKNSIRNIQYQNVTKILLSSSIT